MNWLIKNGGVADFSSGEIAPVVVCIADDKIAAVGKIPDGFHPAREFDAAGCVVAPGIVDADCDLSGESAQEMQAAAAGGITAAVSPINSAAASSHLQIVKTASLLADDGQMADLPALADDGIAAFFAPPGLDSKRLFRILQFAATFDFLVLFDPRDPSLSADAVLREGEKSARLGLPSMPAAAEIAETARILALASASGVRAHFRGISAAESAKIIGDAKAKGADVSCDAALANLFLRDEDGGDFDLRHRIWPPLGDSADRDSIAKFLADGVVDFIVSGHRPLSGVRRTEPFCDAIPSASGVGLLLPLMLEWANQRRISPAIALSKISLLPSRRFGIDGGEIKAGAIANLCVVDLHSEWTIDEAQIAPGGMSPFHGRVVKGRSRLTVYRGKIARCDE